MQRIEGLFAAMRAATQHLEWQWRDSVPVDAFALAEGLDHPLSGEALTDAALAHAGLALYADEVSQALCQYFRSSHASLWLLDGEPGRYRLRCLGSYAADGVNPQAPLCEQSAHPEYFDALLKEGVFRCPDALLDERAATGAPLPTWRAMLDVCGQINGKTIGIAALGQRDESREWTKREELELRRAAAKACLQVHSLRSELETA